MEHLSEEQVELLKITDISEPLNPSNDGRLSRVPINPLELNATLLKLNIKDILSIR